MDLTTRCPQCADQFEVSLQQLQLRKGYIRCGNCAHIFDAYEAVVPVGVSEPPAATVQTSGQAARPEPSFSASATPAAAPETHFTASPAQSEPTPEPRFVVSPTGRDDTVGIPIRTRHPDVDPPFTSREPDPYLGDSDHRIGDGAEGLYIEPRPGREAGPDFIHEDERTGIGFGGAIWSLLILIGLVAAVLQAAYIYRVQLASEIPALRPALERYCETLKCTVDYPRRIGQIAIMDSSLQAVRGEGANEDGGRMMLNVVLRNNYERPQQWPNLSVELVDFSGTVAARRLLAPSDYLPELSLQRPFPARSEVRVTVPVTVRGVQINGYQLDKFFP